MGLKHHLTLSIASYIGMTTVLVSSFMLKLVDHMIKWALVSEGRCAICMKLKPDIRYESVVCADCSRMIAEHQQHLHDECECDEHHPEAFTANNHSIMYR